MLICGLGKKLIYLIYFLFAFHAVSQESLQKTFIVLLHPKYNEQDGTLGEKNPSGDDLSIGYCRVQKWNYYNDTWVMALMLLPQKYKDLNNAHKIWWDNLGLDKVPVEISIIKRDKNKFNVLAFKRVELMNDLTDAWHADIHDESCFKLDLAPYQIRDNEYAVGIRQKFLRFFNGGSEESEILYLFRVEDKKIKMISNLVTFESDTDEEEGTYFDNSTVSVSMHKTNGFFDLIVKTVEDKGRGTRQTESYYLKWNLELGQYESIFKH